jgi:uncharacterized protein (TIGR02147 family)
MSHWYYIAIREMAALPGFKLDAEWIQGRLKGKVSVGEVKTALEFLMSHGYLTVGKDGSSSTPKSTLECEGSVYWPALVEYHKQMFALATGSIHATDAKERNLDGCTLALDQARYDKAVAIMNEAMEKVLALETKEGPAGERIYHFEVGLFPLTKKEDEE